MIFFGRRSLHRKRSGPAKVAFVVEEYRSGMQRYEKDFLKQFVVKNYLYGRIILLPSIEFPDCRH